MAWRMAHDDRVIAAVASESRRLLRGGHPEAVNALHNLIRDPTARGHDRAVMALLDRVDPIIGRQQIEVSHRVIDPDTEALEELRAMRALGATREKLIELFGGNALPRLERLEAAELAKRSDEAKIIEGDVIAVANG
jgi:hypothetical protein